jgi:hypothetical protein
MVDKAPETEEVSEAKQQMENLAKQDAAAGDMWSKAVRYNKIIQKLKRERDEARREAKRCRDDLFHSHHVTCSHCLGPIGGPGCVCYVGNKYDTRAYEE